MRLVAFAIVSCFSMMALTGSASAAKGGLRSCKQSYNYCKPTADPRYVGGCDAYYQEALKTGFWPAFGSRPAFACSR